MPNQLNYEQDIQNITIEEDIFRFATPNSFVINNLYGDGLIGLDLDREFIELHLYDQTTDNLIKSVSIPLSEGYLTVINDTEQENIDFQLQFWRPGDENNPDAASNSLLIKYLNDVPPGTYNIIINFFSDELGSYYDRKWRIKQISNSRKELIIEHDPNEQIDIRELSQFIDKSIFVSNFQQFLTTNFSDQKYLAQFNASLSTSQQNVINSNNLNLIISEFLNSLFNIIYARIDTFVDNEIINKNFRITKNNFETEVNNIISEVVSEYLNGFPTQDGGDSGVIPLFINQ